MRGEDNLQKQREKREDKTKLGGTSPKAELLSFVGGQRAKEDNPPAKVDGEGEGEGIFVGNGRTPEGHRKDTGRKEGRTQKHLRTGVGGGSLESQEQCHELAH